MSYSWYLKRFLLGCVIAFTLAARFAFEAWLSLLGPFAELLGLASVLALLAAIIEAYGLEERLDSDDSGKASQSLLVERWLKRNARSDAQNSLAANVPTEILKKVA